MKTVYLLRHAKSSWSEPRLSDHDRPLAARGLAAAPRMGEHLSRLRPGPGLVLCSSSVRTRQTWELVAAQLDEPPPTSFRRECYHASADDLLRLLQSTDDSIDAVLLIGHNPGLADLAESLAGRGPALELGRLRLKFPTAALACFRFDTPTWRALTPGAGELSCFVRPRDLTASE